MKPHIPIALMASLLTFAGCGSGNDDGNPFGSGGSGGADASDSGLTQGGSGDDGGSGAGTEGGADGGVKYDVEGGQGEGAGEGGMGEGCKKADILFVIDNSGSMQEEQINLANSFPGFVQAIRETLDEIDGDYHVMITDSDANPYSGCVETCMQADMNECNQFPDFCVCMNKDGTNPVRCVDAWASPYGDSCDNTLGAGVVFPRGGGASEIDCGVEGGKRFMTKSQTDLEGTFACAARVGTSGDHDEQFMQAAMAALSPPLLGAGGCNEGFVRDDAILVVVFLTDAGDRSSSDASGGTPAQWRDALLAAKGGNQTAVTVLAVMNDQDDANGVCDDQGWGSNPKLRELTDLFGPRGLHGSICESDYTPFFVEAVETVIETTCTDYVPEG